MEWFSSRYRTRIVELTGQEYRQINWDNPGYPWIVICGPERGPEEVLRRWVWNVQSSVTKHCVHHDIPSYFGISNVIIKYETLNQVKFHLWTFISQFGKRYPVITRHMTYPWISLWYLCKIGYRGLTWLNLTYTSSSFFQRRKVHSWYKSVQTYLSWDPWTRISRMSNYHGISHLFISNFELCRDIPSVFV